MFHVAEHSCGDCKLKCIDCNAQICPKCLVQCPVGNRCKHCTERFTSHVLQIDVWTILRGFAAAFVAGLLFGVAQIVFFAGGFYMWFIVYFVGTFVGNLIFKISGRKIGRKIATVVAIGLLAGSLCISFAWQNLYGTTLKNILAQSMAVNSIPATASTTNQPNVSANPSQPASSVPLANKPTGNNSADSAAAFARAQAYMALMQSPISFSLIIFIIGAISPFLGWGNPLAGFFRRW